MERAVYTRKEISKIMGLAPATIDRLIRIGEIPSFRPSPRRIVIPRAAFDKWLNERVDRA